MRKRNKKRKMMRKKFGQMRSVWSVLVAHVNVKAFHQQGGIQGIDIPTEEEGGGRGGERKE